MPGRFRSRSARRLPSRAAIALFVVAAALAIEVFRIAIPFHTVNPLYQEATVGQPVIDGWMYGGQDEEGYLRFYNQGQTIVIPPSSHTFDANGQFVVIEKFTPNSLVFAQPYDAIPVPWLLAGFGVVLIVMGFAMNHLRKNRKMFMKGKGPGAPLSFRARKPAGPSVKYSKHFRARRGQSPRFRP
ncbi:hypothetical protein LLE49_03780 [Alicyclobacillus tolerans]|uniref:hypothetical protein n=1 Tax=Alicyclobacillus tolerans TaxID=90970 RepID=UPI001F4386D5|nr:hypothetical protein [Alicyclobacillus tolerans]MCF8563860.1 hypothetical protein [Alicyclobacillus tolerans]